MASIRIRLMVLTIGSTAALLVTGGLAFWRLGALKDDLGGAQVRSTALVSMSALSEGNSACSERVC